MKITPVQPDEAERRIPKLLNLILTQLEVLKISRMYSTEKILASFHDLDNKDYFEHKWDDFLETKLQQVKERVNKNEFKVSEETELRVLAQLVIDFLEGLSEPAISQVTINQLSKLTMSGMKSQEILEKQLMGETISDRLGSAVRSVQ